MIDGNGSWSATDGADIVAKVERPGAAVCVLMAAVCGVCVLRDGRPMDDLGKVLIGPIIVNNEHSPAR